MRGPRGNSVSCSTLCQFSVTSPATHNQIGLSGANSQVGVFVYILGPVGLSNELSCEAGSFSHCYLNPHRCFQSEALRLYFLVLEPWVVWSVWLPICSSWFICAQMWDHPGHQSPPCQESSPLGCLSPPLLLVCMNVSSLTPWLSDFHTVWFSVSSGCFCFYICCCPSFGCVRRHSVSTYASILAGSPHCKYIKRIL